MRVHVLGGVKGEPLRQGDPPAPIWEFHASLSLIITFQYGEDFTFWFDELGEAESIVAAAGADVGDHFTGLDLEGFDQLGGLLLFFALGAFQPVGRLMPHDLGDLPAHVELADAIGIVIFAVFITGMLGIGWLRGFVGPEEGTNPDDNAEQNEMPAPNFHNVVPRRNRTRQLQSDGTPSWPF